VALEDTDAQLVAFLDQYGVQYRLIDHAPEGRTEIVSSMRGNVLSQAAKCIVLMVKIGKMVTRYVLAVIPGDARVDWHAVKALMIGHPVAHRTGAEALVLRGRGLSYRLLRTVRTAGGLRLGGSSEERW
jgi:Ala-tRNA(Pro) deacylase